MRSIWKGEVSFGLVNVPVKVYSATEDHDVPLHQVHEKDGGRIRYQRTCEVCGETVAYADIDRAYVEEGQTVAEGDLVVVLEAMKMENPVAAHKSGVVSGITAVVGETVVANTVLCEIKDAG